MASCCINEYIIKFSTFLFTGRNAQDMYFIWTSSEDCYLQEKWCTGYGWISFLSCCDNIVKRGFIFSQNLQSIKNILPIPIWKKKLESDWYSESFDAYVFILKLSDSQPNTSIKLKSFKRKFTKVLRCFTKI